jgi:hypothetical protein
MPERNRHPATVPCRVFSREVLALQRSQVAGDLDLGRVGLRQSADDPSVFLERGGLGARVELQYEERIRASVGSGDSPRSTQLLAVELIIASLDSLAAA